MFNNKNKEKKNEVNLPLNPKGEEKPNKEKNFPSDGNKDLEMQKKNMQTEGGKK